MKCTRPHTKDYHTGNGKQHPCGYCPACKANERAGWTFRVSEHARYQKEAWFITLTYDQENIPLLDHQTGEYERGMENNRQNMCETLLHEDCITFINSTKKRSARLHKELGLKPPKISYYAVGEYGTRYGRPHYHIIMFNLVENIREIELETIWNKGRVEREYLSPALIHYATGYLHEKNKYIVGKQQKPQMSCSKGIGKQYVERNKKWHKELLNPWIPFNGKKIPMPRYLKEKIFTQDELELINEKIMQEWDKNQNPPLLHETKQQRQQDELSINLRTRKQHKL